MNMWFYIGIGLLIWAFYDFLNGRTWTYREIYRRYEPGLYWTVAMLWFVLAISAIYAGLN